jgi:predicted NBD/HSP70 family sugar kinase
MAKGDPVAEAVRQSVIRYLAIGIANIANGFNPEMVIVGGEIAREKNLFYADLLRQSKEHCLERSFSGLTIAFSELEDQAAALGVAHLMLERVI